jgi:hypothetical protein
VHLGVFPSHSTGCITRQFDAHKRLCVLTQPCHNSSRLNMPVCVVCSKRFRGPGTRCAQHSSTRRTYNYNSDSTDPSSIHGRMGDRTRPRHAHFVDNHDMYGYYDSNNAVVRYGTHGDGHHLDSQSTDLAQSVVQVFDTSSTTHAIAAAEYSVNPSTGAYSFSAQANLDREQCTVCRLWFPNHYKLECHQLDFPIGCEECGVCLRRDSVAWHADMEKHERCFVRECVSGFRVFGNWKYRFVKRHILETHYRGY